MFDNLRDQSVPPAQIRSKCAESIISKSSETLVAQIGKCKLTEIDNAYN